MQPLSIARSRPFPTPLRAAALAAALAAGGCHAYVPLSRVEPDPERTLAFEINDRGRAELAENVGPGTTRVEGTLVEQTDSEYVVSVSQVHADGGKVYKWNGERVRLPQSYVREVRERQSRPAQTALAVGGITAFVAFFVVTRGLGVLGGSGSDGPPVPGPGDGSEQ